MLKKRRMLSAACAALACMWGVGDIAAEEPEVYGLVDAVVCDGVDPTAAWPFRSDKDQIVPSYAKKTKVTSTISRTDADWAPVAVFQGERYDTVLTNTFSNLKAGAAYKVDYFSAETYFDLPGKRVFDVFVNDRQVVTNMDLYALSGAKNKAVTRTFDATADAGGMIRVSLVKSVDNAKYGGLAIRGAAAPTNPTLRVSQNDGTNSVTLAYNATDALCYYAQKAPSADGPWTDLGRTLNGQKTWVAEAEWNVTAYYRVICSNGVGTVTTPVRGLKPAFAVYAHNLGAGALDVGRFGQYDFRDSSKPLPLFQIFDLDPGGLDDIAHPVPAQVLRSFLYSDHLRFVYPNLRTDMKYEIRFFAADNYDTDGNKRLFNVSVNGVVLMPSYNIFTAAGGVNFRAVEGVMTNLTPAADGTLALAFDSTVNYAQICAIEVVELDSAGVPLKPVLKGAYARKEGNSLAIAMQTADLTYEIQRKDAAGTWTTLVADGGCGWLDVGAGADAVYRVRARNAVGAVSDWSDEVAVTPEGQGPEKFIGICPESLHGTVGPRGVYRRTSLYNRTALSETTANGAATADRSAILDPLPDRLYTRCWYNTSTTQTMFTNLYPHAWYKFRWHAVEQNGNYGIGSRRYTIRLNNVDRFRNVDAFATYGRYRPFVLESLVQADGAGAVYLYSATLKDASLALAYELVLQEVGDGAGAGVEYRSGAGTDRGRAEYEGVTGTIALDGAFTSAMNEAQWSGQLIVPETGTYTFTYTQGGAGYLFIDDTEPNYVNASGTVATVKLAEGVHAIRFRYRRTGDSASAQLKWKGPHLPEQVVGGVYLKHDASLPPGSGEWNVQPIGLSYWDGDFRQIGTAADGDPIWKISSAGEDVYLAHDKVYSAYQAVDGEFEVVARIREIRHGSHHPKAGVGIRTSLESGKGDYFWFSCEGTVSNDYSVAWYWCAEGDDYRDGVNNQEHDKVDNVKQVNWVRVRRFRDKDGVFKTGAAYSADGTTWKEKVYMCTNMKPVYAGFFLCAHTDWGLAHAVFDNFKIIRHPTSTIFFIR